MRTLLALAAALAFASPAAAQYPYGPDEPPPGANDFGCKPTAAHPNPVVLVHGLGATAYANWSTMSPALADAGYCVYALTYGRKLDNPFPFDQNGGLVRMEESAVELAAFIDRVLQATGAAQVDIVGHSEGSLMPNYYVRFLPQARYEDGTLKVRRYVGITPLWDGTDAGGLGTISTQGEPTGLPAQAREAVAEGCESCPQFLKGSAFIAKMNSGGGPREPGVDYTMIMTRYDELVFPYTSGEMEGARNIVVQDQCPADPSEHLAVAYDPIVVQDVLNALDPARNEVVDCADAVGAF